jgi:hypothetical protein
LVHEENELFLGLGAKIKEKYGFDCVVPQMDQEFDL